MKTKHIVLIISGAIVIILAGVLTYFFAKSKRFKSRLLQVALDEAKKWESITELSPKASNYLLDYWKATGINFTAKQMQSSSFQSSYPWSSAFISYLFKAAGANDQFPYSASHTKYAQYAKKYRDDQTASLRGFRITEYAPKVGDLVVYTRQTGKGYHSKGYFPSHGEVVTEIGKGFIRAIGGNVSNRVKISKYTTDEKGFLTTKEVPFFMVIQNNIK